MQLFIIILFATVMTIVKTTDTVNRPVNVAVVVDSYDSIGIDNFGLVMRQISSTIQNLTLDPNNLFVGVLFYYANNFICVGLTDNKALLKMMDAKETLYFTKTATEDINKIEGSMLDTIDFIFAQNTRPQAENKMVVITFGEYTDDPTSALEIATEENITVDVISIGHASQAYLMKVTGSTDRITRADNLLSVGSVLNNFFAKTIGGLKNELNNAVVEGKRADIAIIIENIFENSRPDDFVENYTLALKQINSVIQNLTLGPNKTLVATYFQVGYECGISRLVQNKTLIENEFARFIKYAAKYVRPRYSGEGTYNSGVRFPLINLVARAISYIFESKTFKYDTRPVIFEPYLSRFDVPNRLIIICSKDHEYNLPSNVLIALKSLGIETYAIGVQNATIGFLEKVAGSSNRAIKIDNYNLLGNTLANLITNITNSANRITTLPISPVFQCDAHIDVIFILNTFSSSANAQSTVNGMLKMFQNMYITSNHANAGIVAFCGTNPIYTNLLSSKTQLMNNMTRCLNTVNSTVTEYDSNQNTNGIQKALDIFAGATNRAGAQDIVIFATDKVPSNVSVLKKEIARLVARNVTVYIIGIGNATYDSLVSVNGAQKTFHCENYDLFEYGIRRVAYNNGFEYVIEQPLPFY